MELLSIVDWDKHFENNRSRELKELEWVPVPNKQDGDGYTELLDHPNGAAHFGAWMAIIQVASKCEIRGTLLRDTAEPHDCRSLARMSRVPVAVFEEVIPRLVKMQWMQTQPYDAKEFTEIPQASATIPHPPAEKCLSNRIESKGTELNRTELCSTSNGRGDQKDLEPESFERKPWEDLLPDVAKVRTVLGKPKSRNDVSLIWKACWLARYRYGEDWLWDSIAAIQNAKKMPSNRYGYFTRCLRSKCEDKKLPRLDLSLATISVPSELLSMPPPQVESESRGVTD